MHVVLMRHGEAVGYGEVERDEDRWLTHAGRVAVRSVARLLNQEGLILDGIWASPLVRATQTAELLADGFGVDAVRAHAAMAPDRGSVDDALAPLGAAPSTTTVALVGHEPKIRALSQRLGGAGAAAGFRTAEARVFEVVAEGARLLYRVDRDQGVLRG